MKVPTKHLLSRCERPVEQRRPRMNDFTIILKSQNKGNNHLPLARAKSVMNAKDNLYNILRWLLKDHGVSISPDLASAVGDGVLRHLSSTLFPLWLYVWNYLISDRHNRVGPPPIQSLVHSLGERPRDTK